MRCAALTGPGNVLPESVPLDLFISDNSRFESSRPGVVAMAMTRTGEEHYSREPEPPGAVTFSSPVSPSGPEAASSGWKPGSPNCHSMQLMRSARSALRWLWVEPRSEEHTSELQSLLRNSYADFWLKK